MRTSRWHFDYVLICHNTSDFLGPINHINLNSFITSNSVISESTGSIAFIFNLLTVKTFTHIVLLNIDKRLHGFLAYFVDTPAHPMELHKLKILTYAEGSRLLILI